MSSCDHGAVEASVPELQPTVLVRVHDLHITGRKNGGQVPAVLSRRVGAAAEGRRLRRVAGAGPFRGVLGVDLVKLPQVCEES